MNKRIVLVVGAVGILGCSAGSVSNPTGSVSSGLIGRAAIRGYFDHFLEQHPVGRIDTRAIVPVGCNTGVVAGLYTFTVDDGTARVDKPARYTFVYVYETAARRWLIAQHHSSAQPQQSATK